jgi:hypothetical protein
MSIERNPFKGNPTVNQAKPDRKAEAQAAADWQKKVDEMESRGVKPGNPFP